LSDIFISYASADRERARVIAEALAARGFSVWWDRVIPPGRQFDEVIEEALDASRCVVVLWSKTSVGSTWVKTEAAEAMSRKALIPAIIEEVKIPLEFRRLQAADLSRWTGDADDPQLEQFFRSIESELGRAASPSAAPLSAPERPPETLRRVEPPPAPAPPPTPRKLSPAVIGIAVAAILAALGGALFYERSRSAALTEQAERMKAAQEAERTAREEAARRAEDERRAADQRRATEARATPPAAPATPRASAPREARGTQSVPSSGTVDVNWRDHALGFSGTLAWTPSTALLRVSVVDLQTRTPIGSYAVPATVAQVAPTDYVVSAHFAVPGDSTTPGPHTHVSKLLFKAQQDGSIRLIQNCPQPGQCY
jgi:hypothetical protein